jgi:hypothetical protein
VVPSIKLLYIVLVLCSVAVLIAGLAIHLQLKRHARASDEALDKLFDGVEGEQRARK